MQKPPRYNCEWLGKLEISLPNRTDSQIPCDFVEVRKVRVQDFLRAGFE